MRQTIGQISIYTPDTFGVASALYELGGMTVMHDASGCNSSYTTHDEPRWYDLDSMVFISGLSEMEAVMGDDQKLIRDITETSEELHPRFIAIAGSPIPMMTGFDFDAAARVIEKRTGVPTFGFATSGMEDYTLGVSMAFERIAERMTLPAGKIKGGINLLGLTPLDFPLNAPERIKALLEKEGFSVLTSWAMGSTLDELIQKTAAAEVNLVLSYTGLAAAKKLRSLYGTPYVTGVPMGAFKEKVINTLKMSMSDGENHSAFSVCPEGDTIVVGESIGALSLASALTLAGQKTAAICPIRGVSGEKIQYAPSEDELKKVLSSAKTILADPLFRPICPDGAEFIRIPHTAYSGRTFEREMPEDIDTLMHILVK